MTRTNERIDERARKEVAVDHQFLKMALSWLASAREEGAIASMVDEMTAYLKSHFAAEERPGGFFDAVVDAAPHHQGRIDELRAQHGRLLEQLAVLRASIEAPYEDASDEVLTKIAEFVKAMRDHEKREGSLLQDAIQRDIGAGD